MLFATHLSTLIACTIVCVCNRLQLQMSGSNSATTTAKSLKKPTTSTRHSTSPSPCHYSTSTARVTKTITKRASPILQPLSDADVSPTCNLASQHRVDQAAAVATVNVPDVAPVAILKEDVSEENVMKLSSSENSECSNDPGDHLINNLEKLIAEDVEEEDLVDEAQEKRNMVNEKSWTSATHLIKNCDIPIVFAPGSCIVGKSTLWQQSHEQLGVSCGLDLRGISVDTLWFGPTHCLPFPSWIADGLRKYFLLAMDIMMHLQTIDLQCPCDLDFSTPFVVHQSGTPCCTQVALRQAMWLSIVWWQAQLFDKQMTLHLQQTIECVANDINLCDALQLDSPDASLCVAQLMLDSVPRDADQILKKTMETTKDSADINAMQHLLKIESAMDMRGWSLSQVAQDLITLKSVYAPQFWYNVGLMNNMMPKKPDIELILVPSFCTILRRINLLRTIFYGYEHPTNMVNEWHDLIMQYMHNMHTGAKELYASTDNYGTIEFYDKQIYRRVQFLLSRVMYRTDVDRVPRDLRTLFLNSSINLLEQCAHVAYCCNAESWNVARNHVLEREHTMLLACLVHAAVVHWDEAEKNECIGGGKIPVKDIITRGWTDIDHLLPVAHNPIISNATLTDKNLMPKNLSVIRWAQRLSQRQNASPAVVLKNRIQTLPIDLTHLLGLTTYYTSSQTYHKTYHTSLLISARDQPDILLHYDCSPNLSLPAWTLINPRRLNETPVVIHIPCHPIADESKSAKLDNLKPVRSTNSAINTFRAHLQAAKAIGNQLINMIPHSYMFDTLQVKANALDIETYSRVSRDNVLQHIARTMPRSMGV